MAKVVVDVIVVLVCVVMLDIDTFFFFLEVVVVVSGVRRTTRDLWVKGVMLLLASLTLMKVYD